MDHPLTIAIPSARGESVCLPVLHKLVSLRNSFHFSISLFCNGWAPSESAAAFLTANDIAYILSASRVPIDDSHRSAIEMSDTEYVYLLGDDDDLDVQMLGYVFRAIENDIDVLVFQVAKTTGYMEFHTFSDAFAHIHDRCTLGRVLSKRNLYPRSTLLRGTSHWYTSFFLGLMCLEAPKVALVEAPDLGPLLAPQRHRKTYLSKVFRLYFVEIPLWYDRLGKYALEMTCPRQVPVAIRSAKAAYINFLFSTRFLKNIVRQLALLRPGKS